MRILERRTPGRLWIVLPYAGTPTDQATFERRFIAPRPQIAIRPIAGALGKLPADRRSRILTGRPFVLPPAVPTDVPYCPMAGGEEQ